MSNYNFKRLVRYLRKNGTKEIKIKDQGDSPAIVQAENSKESSFRSTSKRSDRDK